MTTILRYLLNFIIQVIELLQTYLYCTPCQSNGHGSCTFHFQHQSLHGKNSRGGIASTPNFFAHNFVLSIQYRKYIVHFDRYRDQNIFYHNNLLKNLKFMIIFHANKGLSRIFKHTVFTITKNIYYQSKLILANSIHFFFDR